MRTSLKNELRNFVNIIGRDGIDIGVISFNDIDNGDNTLDAFYELLSYDKVLTIGGAMFIDIPPQKEWFTANIRVSTAKQSVESQKNLISRYLMDKRLHVDEWIALEIPSRKSLEKRGITALPEKLSKGDTLIISELSRLGRSIKEVLQIIETLLEEKQCRLVLV